MVQQTVYARVSTRIPAVSNNFRFSGGTATVQLDSLGNYEILINGNRFSSQENTAKRDSAYKGAVADVSSQMLRAYDKRDAEFINLHDKSPKLLTLKEQQDNISKIPLQQYQREKFPMTRPLREDIRQELQQEASIRFADLYEDRVKEQNDFIIEHEKDAMAQRLRAFEEIQDFFSSLQDDKAAKINAVFQKEHDRQCKEIEDFINGEQKSTEERLRTILGEINLPFEIDVVCEYIQNKGLLTVDLVLPTDLNIPTKKANILSSGRVSVKDKLVKELEQQKTDTIISLVYYIAASLFNASINIKNQRISVWTEGKSAGLMWVEFDRNKFSKLNMWTTNVSADYYEWPHIDDVKVVRGASQFNEITNQEFKNSINQLIQDNEVIAPTADDDTFVVSRGYAQMLMDALPDDDTLRGIFYNSDLMSPKLVLPKKYKGILKEIKK